MKKTSQYLVLLLVLLSSFTFAQRNAAVSNISASLTTHSSNGPSIVIHPNDPVFPIEILGTVYEPELHNLPVWISSFTTSVNEDAELSITPTHYRKLNGDEQQVVQKHFSEFISTDFQIKYRQSYSGDKKVWGAYIIPFRKNADGSVDFLQKYQSEWKKTISQKYMPTSVQSFTNQSVLSTGNWYKIGIKNSGIYKIDKTFLQSMGIDVSQIDPRNIRIYGNGGEMINPKNNKFRYDDLQENAIYVSGESDGVFDNNDYILFYGKGSDSWIKKEAFPYSNPYSCLDYFHYYHRYSDSAYYFLTVDLGPGLRINTYSTTAISSYTTNSYDYMNYHEIDAINFLKSGPDFYGEYFDLQTSYSFPFADGNFVTGDTIKAFLSLAARGDVPSYYTWSFGGASFTFSANPVQTGNYLADYASVSNQCQIVPNNNNAGTITFNITKNTSNAVAWLDKLVFNARRYLVYNNKAFEFSDKRTVKVNQVSTYSIAVNTSLSLFIWDISDPIHPFNQSYLSFSNYLTFEAPSDTLHKYIIFSMNDVNKPKFIKKISNQNLHSIAQADYIIITHPLFKSQALELATLHQQEEGLSYAVVTTEEVYNEFSSGNPDATALREFVRMLYKRNTGYTRPKYLLLFGDGSYLNKDRTPGTSALIPTYQTGVSTSPVLSTVTDDFYGWLDDNEGDDWASSLVDIGIGRFTVANTAQATNVVNKVKAYYKKNYSFSVQTSDNCCKLTSDEYPQGDWRTIFTFLGDDGDAQLHMQQADSLSKFISNLHPEYNVNKIMADAYQQITVPGGNRFPDATAALDKAFEKGSLVINYTGHGNAVQLGHEAYLTLAQINNYRNLNNMPLFITATCDFGPFDDPDRLSAGEQCFLQPNGCSIAMLTTVRLAYASTNFWFSQKLFETTLDTLPPYGKHAALGDIIKITKIKTNIGFYFLNFHILGDPALVLAYPRNKVVVTSINNNPIGTTAKDTLKALSKVTVSGFVADKNGNKMSNFNGIIYPTVFDKAQVISGLGNKQESLIGNPPRTFTFVAQKNILFKGKVEVKNGDFTFSFIVPKDINYAIDTSKMSFYAHNGIEDAIGYTSKFYVGGSNPYAAVDNQPPHIDLFMNDKKFVDGGITNTNPVLLAEIVDSSGINITGTSIGHDLMATLDNTKQINLNDYFEYDLNSYQKGKVKYPFSNLAEGNHQLALKAWDINNNSQVSKITFVVAKDEELALKHVLNYPNPFTTKTKFMFEFNTSCEQIKIKVEIFTITGKLVKTLTKEMYVSGYREDGIEWDGKDDYGDKLARGVYIYRVSITDSNKKHAEKIEKLVILN